MSSDTSSDMDLDTDILWEGDVEEQANPGPPLPADELQPLLVDEGHLFTDGQLEAIVAEPAQDPAPEAPPLTPAQQVARFSSALLQHIKMWSEEVEAHVGEQGRRQDAGDD